MQISWNTSLVSCLKIAQQKKEFIGTKLGSTSQG